MDTFVISALRLKGRIHSTAGRRPGVRFNTGFDEITYLALQRTRTHPSKGGHRAAVPYSRSKNLLRAASCPDDKSPKPNPMESCQCR
jgi:hypothetical protein